MREILQKNWWSVSIRGVLLVAFGIFTLVAGSQRPEELIIYLGITELIVGVIYIVAGISTRKEYKNWTALIVLGVIDLVFGIFALVNQERAADYFGVIVGVFGIALGLILLLMSIRTQKMRIFLYINGGISIAFGLVIFFNPFADNIQLLNFIVGSYTVVLGVFIIYAGFRMRSLHKMRIMKVLEQNQEEEKEHPSEPGSELPPQA